MERTKALLVLLFFLLWSTGENLAAATTLRIMPLGDSITVGCCNSVEGGYRTQLANLLANAGYKIDYVGTQTSYSNNPFLMDRDHEGHGGAEIGALDAHIATWLNAVEGPDVILLHIGTNDFAGNNDVANAKTRLENLIAHIVSLRPNAVILVSNLLPRTDLPVADQQIQSLFNPYVPSLVARQANLGRSVSFVDLHSVCGIADLADGLHPSVSGYNKMAQAWFDALTQVINPDGTLVMTPTIAEQPSSQAVSAGWNARFTVVATGPGNLTYQWRLNGVPIPGATLPTYTLSSAQLSHAGTYTVAVANAWGTVLSAPAVLSLVPEGLLANGSFEADFAGWVGLGNILIIPSGGLYSATHGTKLAVFNSGNSTPNGVLLHGFNTTPGQTYRLSFDVGVLAFNQNEQRLALSVHGAKSLLTRTVSVFGVGNGLVKWFPHSHTFVADSSTTSLMLQDLSPSTAALDLLLDNVRVSPEGPLLRTLSITSFNPASGVTMRLAPGDVSGLSAGTTALSRSYAHGTLVTVTAPTMAGGNTFSKWQRDGLDYSSTPRVSVTMDGNHTLQAIYVPTRTLRVNATGADGGAMIRLGPADNNGEGNGPPGLTRLYGDGTTVLVAAPLVVGDRRFQKWQRNGVDYSTAFRVSFALTSDVTLTAVY